MYADITTVASYLSIILEILLATIQSKNYWVFKKRYVEFDERQTEDRHVIFEKSYKYMFAAAYLGLVPFITFMIALPKIVENNNGFFPGYIFWLPINVVTLLFTLPYILASFRNK